MASAAIVTPLTSSAARVHMEKSTARGGETPISDLTQGLANGDEEAFRKFHAAYFERLLRYLFVIAKGDEYAAREALQETMTRVVRYARRFDSEEMFWNWLTVLARSAVVDAGRKRQRYWRLLKGYALFCFRAEPQPADQSDTDEYWNELLKQGLQQLEPIDRSLVEGKYLAATSVRELAGQSGLTDRAVESRLLRARKLLREELLKRLKNEKAI